MNNLSQLPNVVELRLVNIFVGDDGLSLLGQLSTLSKLALSDNGITEAGSEGVGAFKHLEHLHYSK